MTLSQVFNPCLKINAFQTCNAWRRGANGFFGLPKSIALMCAIILLCAENGRQKTEGFCCHLDSKDGFCNVYL